MKTIVRRLALPAVVAAAVGGSATLWHAERTTPPALEAQAIAAPAAAPEELASAFRAGTRAVMPAVVRVEVETAPRAVAQQIPDEFRGTPFEDFFRGAPRGESAPRSGSGSGFIISPDGYVLTNNHVVEHASRVTVTLTDKREFEAEVIGRDPNTDIAVLKIDGRELPVAQLGNADGLEIGDWVLALGYPLSLGETVTAGIVSAKGRSIGIMRRTEEAPAPLEHFIQTDAAINPGNSGGPLVNLRGEVVGVNSAIASPTGFYSGYGFAVPINLARRVADDLIRHGEVRRPRLGIQITDVTTADVEIFRLPSSDGAVVSTAPEGHARDAGVQIGDVIVGVDGAAVRNTGDLMERIALRQPGERVVLEVIRYGEPKRIPVTLGSFENGRVARDARTGGEAVAGAGRLGFQAAVLTPELARQIGSTRSGGVVITRVAPGAAPAQLEGLTIERLNGREIRSLRDLESAAAGLQPRQAVSVVGRTPDGEQTIVNYRLRG